MPRKQFLADVAAASEKGIPNVIKIRRGDDDGDVNFLFLHDATEPIEIGLLALGTFFCLLSSSKQLVFLQRGRCYWCIYSLTFTPFL